MKTTNLPADGTFLGRVRSPNVAHPIIVTVHDGTVVNITSNQGPPMFVRLLENLLGRSMK